jgi:hypothetical protein
VKEALEESWTREEAVSYRRFRIGHSLELAQYAHRIGKEASDLCYRCGEGAEDTRHVMLECPATERWRSQFNITCMKELCTKPGEVLKMWNWFERETS